jgi:hypothetical protein
MPELLAELFRPILTFPLVERVRKNHGLEHATLNILAQRHHHLVMAGYSNTGGFWLIGDLPTEEIQSALAEAEARLRAGERHLAIHPNCGTNFVTAGLIAGLAGAMAMFGAGQRFRDKLERLPLAFTLATLGVILARPLGMLLQEQVTTSGELGNLNVVDVVPIRRGSFISHRVITRG